MKQRILWCSAIAMLALTVFMQWRPWLPHDPRVDERQQRFQDFRSHLRELRDVAERSSSKDRASFRRLAGELQEMSRLQWRDIDARFPADTQGGRSAASPMVWSDRAGFANAAARFQTAVDDLLGEAVGAAPAEERQAAVQSVTAACQGCHEHYRE